MHLNLKTKSIASGFFFLVFMLNSSTAWTWSCVKALGEKSHLITRISEKLSGDGNVNIYPSADGRSAKLEFDWEGTGYRLKISDERDSKLEVMERGRLWPPNAFAKIMRASDGTPLLVIEGISQSEFYGPGGGYETLIVKKLALLQVDLNHLKLKPLDSLIYSYRWEDFKFSWFDGQLSIDDEFPEQVKVTREIDLDLKKFRKRDSKMPFTVAARFDPRENKLIPVGNETYFDKYSLSPVLINEARGGFTIEVRTARFINHLDVSEKLLVVRIIKHDPDIFDLKEFVQFLKEENLPFGSFVEKDIFERLLNGEALLFPFK